MVKLNLKYVVKVAVDWHLTLHILYVTQLLKTVLVPFEHLMLSTALCAIAEIPLNLKANVDSIVWLLSAAKIALNPFYLDNVQ